MQENKGLDSVPRQVLYWCNSDDTGVVTSEPPGCNYDQNLGYCTSFAFLMAQNLYFSTAWCGRQTAVWIQSLKITLKFLLTDGASVLNPARTQSCQHISSPFCTLPYSPRIVNLTSICSFPVIKAHPLGVLSYKWRLFHWVAFNCKHFKVCSCQKESDTCFLLCKILFSDKLLIMPLEIKISLLPLFNWLFHVFLISLAFHLLLQRFWEW